MINIFEKRVLKKLLPVVLLALFFASCKTNPPVSPIDNRVSGKIFLNINYNFVPQTKIVDKIVLLEDFANVSCVPCVTSNKIIESLTKVTYGDEKLVAVKYPTYFPAPNDLFYLANKTICDSLISYYNIFFAPTTIIDGINRPSSIDSLALKQKIDERLVVASPFEVLVSENFAAGSYYVDVNINSLTALDLTNLVLRVVIIEKEIEFTSPPGSNGETKFYNVMREILPSFSGISLPDVQQSGLNVQNIEGDLRAGWQTDQLKTIVFIQNKVTKEILQAGISLN